MKKLLIIAVLVLCLTALVSVGASGGGANYNASIQEQDQHILMLRGGSWRYGNGTLYNLIAQASYDMLIIINVGTSAGNLEVFIEDCCVMGDTMVGVAIGPGGTLGADVATSPDTVQLGPFSIPVRSYALVVTGYTACPGGFPAGYYWDVYF